VHLLDAAERVGPEYTGLRRSAIKRQRQDAISPVMPPTNLKMLSQPTNSLNFAEEQGRRFVRGWEIAGPIMQQLREDRLRRMSESEGAKMLGVGQLDRLEVPEGNGLAIWQSWMMRLRIQQLDRNAGRDS